jgi:hypothetical protein
VTISTSSAATPPHHDLVVVTPCYDDWGALPRLLDALENAIAALGLDGHVLVVNDGGSMLPDALAEQLAQETGLRCEIIDLSTNLGHQRAIAIGLAYAEANLSADHLLVMDADGEDNPAALADLLAVARKTPRAIVFAERTARSEGPLFRAGYALFKRLFRALSGQAITFGNFSLVPWSMLRSLVVSSELWVHYAAGVIRARLPFVTVPVARAPRYAGESQMSLAGLILHGMSAISLFTDVAAVRVLLFALGVRAAVRARRVAVLRAGHRRDHRAEAVHAARHTRLGDQRGGRPDHPDDAGDHARTGADVRLVPAACHIGRCAARGDPRTVHRAGDDVAGREPRPGGRS